VTWMNVATQDGPFDMYVEDLASLFTLDQNTLLSHSTAAWNTTRHTDTKVDDYYARYAREMDPAKRKAIAREFQEFMTDKLYWNTISGSPFYEVAQPWMKDYVYNAEWKVLYKKVWLDKYRGEFTSRPDDDPWPTLLPAPPHEGARPLTMIDARPTLAAALEQPA